MSTPDGRSVALVEGNEAETMPDPHFSLASCCGAGRGSACRLSRHSRLVGNEPVSGVALGSTLSTYSPYASGAEISREAPGPDPALARALDPGPFAAPRDGCV